MTATILERLAAGPVLGDGGYLLELEKRGYVQAGPFTPEVSLTHPEALAELHREFLLAGAEVLQTLTFYASEEKLSTVGLAGKVEEINRAVDIVGINCLRSPATTLPLMREVRDAVSGFIGCQPVAYRTPEHQHDFTALEAFPLGLDPLQLTREEMASYATEAREIGIDYIGSCCGSVACHVKAMAVALGKRPGSEREWRSRTGRPMSAYEHHEQGDPR
jgi:methionine synthase I (cobalamin-dependent)